MIDIVSKYQCTGCHSCESICPVNAISMIADNEGFLYPQLDKELCTECGLCIKVCPVLKPKTAETIKPKAYAAWNNNEKIRVKSSSGGVFQAIAERTLLNNGVVFGASFDKDFKVIHTYCDTIEGLKKFRGSKYVQSTIGNTYIQAKDFLEDGKDVLFSGTPCQVEGLKNFLRKDYDNLICIGLICHGVPSPLVWKRYLNENFDLKTIKDIQFRDKTFGWENWALSINKQDSTYKKDFHSDPYLRCFLTKLAVRPSCFNCVSKGISYGADIILGDLWGAEKIGFKDVKEGVSEVIVCTGQGKVLFEDIKKSLLSQEVSLKDAFSNQPYLFTSAAKNPLRSAFFKELQKNTPIISLIKNYTTIKIHRRLVQLGIHFSKKILLAIYRPVKMWLTELEWKRSAKQLSTSISKIDKLEKIDVSKKTLILIPHADDELVGCDTIIRNSSQAIDAFYFAYSNQLFDANGESIRLKELKQYEQELPLHIIESSNRSYVECLNELLTDNAYDQVFLPSFIDWHHEHIAVNTALLNAIDAIIAKRNEAFTLPSIVMYNVSVPIPSALITHHFPMSKALQQKKWSTFTAIYKSQRTLPIKRFMLQERINGQYSGDYANEVFALQSFEDWKRLYKRFMTYRDKYSFSLKMNDVYNMKNIRKKSESIYQLITSHE